MTVSRASRTGMSAIFLAFALAASPGAAASQEPAKACGLLPIDDIEALYKAKISAPPHGTDSKAISICTVTVASQAVKVSSSPPGTPGVATSVQQGLAALQSMAASSKTATKPETKDYGDVGCVRFTIINDFDKKPLPKPVHTTSCFQVTGGYLILTIASDDPTIATDDHVKGLLAKAAARRKTP